MMKTSVYIAASLDGFIAAPDGGIDWLSEYPNPEGGDLGYSDFMKDIDLIIMGRKTFETVLSFGEWPYDKPVWVLSRTMKSLPAHLTGKVEVVNDSPESLLTKAAEENMSGVYVDGGGAIRTFLEADLIDEMIITTIPVVLGGGIPLFTELSGRLHFELKTSETLIGQLVKSHYTRKR